ncbi:hypothetical protein [Acidovorax sp. CCYZU-2555]|uniref:hypothetical protein n=1 Tax=Acidovorax sp. CCYZU-2555 TaxID=2835042 RepID=UPI001BD111CC|nr:hypothetical protein [Acidovorax sp. CCYZU-2555]MBS7777599.1 hypothetical protein [Acidovorax sp. CCYZU-2555]
MTAINATSVVSAPVLQSLDIETALMAVQTQRASLLEEQLKGQLEDVQQRNAQIGKLNEALGAARELSAQFSDKDDLSKEFADKIKDEKKAYEKTDAWKSEHQAIADGFSPEDKEIYKQALMPHRKTKNPDRLRELVAMASVPDNKTATGLKSEKLQKSAAAANIALDVKNKGELEKAIENLKSMIDTHSNSQQMDMLRLQSLSNKRNEAFDVMTNFVKKMQDSRSSIVGNQR